MHLGACTTLLFRYHNNPHLKELLKRITKEKLVGALSASDPATGKEMEGDGRREGGKEGS